METVSRNETEARVIALIAQLLGKDPSEIHVDILVEDLSQDSIQLFEIVTLFEREFNSRVTYEDLMQIEKVGDIVDYAQKILEKGSNS